MTETLGPSTQACSPSWDDEVDVAVVGFGGAGSCAAIEARRLGARVLVIDRFSGGGATARSGGVVYLGGGSTQQRLAGYDDDSEEMFKYLSLEVGDAVDERTLRAFCAESLSNLAWLESLGLPFPPSGSAPVKTSYPADECTLYFSGNELVHPYSARARPAPRGHRAPGAGLTGHVLYDRLREATLASGAQVRYRSRAARLFTDADGCVYGLEILSLPASSAWNHIHAALFQIATNGAMLSRSLGARCRSMIARLESKLARPWRVRVRGGVILCAGGFIQNPEMMNKHAKRYAECMPLGTAGDDGNGIALGQSAGGATGQMGRCSAWRFINPPEAFTRGVLVDAQGQRICNEELYGAKLGECIGEEHAGCAFLVIDSEIATEAHRQIREQHRAFFQKITAFMNLFINRYKALSLDELGSRCGMPPGALRATLEAYNAAALRGGPDEYGKAAHLLRPIRTPPFYAINCSVDNPKFPTPCLTLGGLLVDGLAGQVLREDGSPIGGLYAAGRNAVGVSSRSYVSGLSLADCIFSGRHAGRHAAASGAAAHVVPPELNPS